MIAALKGSWGAVTKLLQKGITHIDASTSDGNTALHFAVLSGDVPSVKSLCSAGANRQIRNVDKETPLDIAVKWNRDECVRILQEDPRAAKVAKAAAVKQRREENARRDAETKRQLAIKKAKEVAAAAEAAKAEAARQRRKKIARQDAEARRQLALKKAKEVAAAEEAVALRGAPESLPGWVKKYSQSDKWVFYDCHDKPEHTFKSYLEMEQIVCGEEAKIAAAVKRRREEIARQDAEAKKQLAMKKAEEVAAAAGAAAAKQRREENERQDAEAKRLLAIKKMEGVAAGLRAAAETAKAEAVARQRREESARQDAEARRVVQCERPNPAGGHCHHERISGGSFCKRHACTHDGCLLSKSSQSKACNVHAHDAEAAAASADKTPNAKTAVLERYRKRLSLYLKDNVLDTDEIQALQEEFGRYGITAVEHNAMYNEIIGQRLWDTIFRVGKDGVVAAGLLATTLRATTTATNIKLPESTLKEAWKVGKGTQNGCGIPDKMNREEFSATVAFITTQGGYLQMALATTSTAAVALPRTSRSSIARSDSEKDRIHAAVEKAEAKARSDAEIAAAKADAAKAKAVAEAKAKADAEIKAAKANEAEAAKLFGVRMCEKLDPSTIHISDDDAKTPIGTGSNAKVLRGTWAARKSEAPQPVAVKAFAGLRVNTLSPSELDQLEREIKVGGLVHSPNLVQTYGHTSLPNHGFCIILELMNGGTLHEALHPLPGIKRPALPIRISWLAQIACGMKALHDEKPRPILHRDLKAVNVMMSADRLHAKVCDFGLAKVESTMMTHGTLASQAPGGGGGSAAGTIGYKAPETYVGRARTGGDVFSFAMVAYQTVSFKVPYAGKTSTEIQAMLMERFDKHKKSNVKKLTKGVPLEELQEEWLEDNPLDDRRPDLTLVEADAQQLISLVEACWADSPRHRPSFAAIYETLHALSTELERQGAAGGGGGDAAEMQAEMQAMQRRTEAMLAAVLANQNTIGKDVLKNRDLFADQLDELKDAVKDVHKAVKKNKKLIEAGHVQLASSFDPRVPWLFVVLPDTVADKKWFKHPKKWLKMQHRVHLLCNGNFKTGKQPHFLFTSQDELAGDKSGYVLLEPTKTLKRWGPVLKFTMGALSMAAKGAANFFGPGLSSMLPALETLFENDDFAGWITEQLQDTVGSIADGITDSVSSDGAKTWAEPQESEYEPCKEHFAAWIEAQDDKILGSKFFGLKYYQNTVKGVGDGKGTPLWLCEDCCA